MSDAETAYEGRGTDPDYDESRSVARRGWHLVAGEAWVDGSMPLPGYKEAPTMDFAESFTKAVRAQNKWKREKASRRVQFDLEDDDF